MKKKPLWTNYLFLILIITLVPQIKVIHKYAKKSYAPHYSTFFQLAKYAAKLPENSVIICRKPALFHMESNQTMTSFLYSDDYEKQLERLREQNVTHVVVDQLGYRQTRQYLTPFMSHYSGKFKRVYSTVEPANHLFEFHYSMGYEGDRKDGKREGYGTYKWHDGSVYKGQWLDNKREGYGILYGSNGNIVKCNWKADKKNGMGIVTLQDSTYIKMKWVDDVSSESGELYSKDGVLIKNLTFR